MLRHLSRPLVHAAAICLLLCAAPASAQQAAALTFESLTEGATLRANGRIATYRKDGKLMLLIPADALGKPFIWYAEG